MREYLLCPELPLVILLRMTGDNLALMWWAREGLRAPVDEEEVLAHGGCVDIAPADCNEIQNTFKWVRDFPITMMMWKERVRLSTFLRSSQGDIMPEEGARKRRLGQSLGEAFIYPATRPSERRRNTRLRELVNTRGKPRGYRGNTLYKVPNIPSAHSSSSHALLRQLDPLDRVQ